MPNLPMTAQQRLFMPNTRAAPAARPAQPANSANGFVNQKLVDYQESIQPLIDISKPLQPLVDAWKTAGNVLAQAGRVPGGAAKGLVNLGYLDAPSVAGMIAREVAPESKAATVLGKHLDTRTDTARGMIAGVDKWSNSWVPAPESQAAQFAATASNAAGEALPGVALALATGGVGAGVAAGATMGAATGGLSAFSKDYMQNEDLGSAVLTGTIEAATEAAGGVAFGSLAGKVSNKALGAAVDAAGEGLEEVVSGGVQALLTGEHYGVEQAAQDFALGATVGTMISPLTGAVNAVNESVVEGRVQRDVSAQMEQAALADVSDVRQLLSRGANSSADAVIAKDSLTALQKQVANPVNTTQTTSNIPTNIAQKHGLVPASQTPNAKPLSVEVHSYESIVNPEVSALTAPEISIAERASVNPNAPDVVKATANNPRALYQYADDIYLRPGTALNGSLFTYRGQANQFYRTSQALGSIPASGVGTSWEGSGVYSAPTPYTTDLYGPSGKLADNPYSNRGIDQTAIDVDYPVGVILRQPAALAESAAPLTRTDAPNDVVAQGERRVRYDNQHRGLVTEIVNNPNDIAAMGLVFGRIGVAEATPVQYANIEAGSAAEAMAVQYAEASTGDTANVNSDTAQTGVNPNHVVNEAANEISARENAVGQYVVPDFIAHGAVSANVGATGKSGGEDHSEGLVGEVMNIAMLEKRTFPSESNTSARESVKASEADAQEAFKAEKAGNVQSLEFMTSQASNVAAESIARSTNNAEQTERLSEALSAEEYASQIWTPVQFMETRTGKTNNDDQRRRKHGAGGIDPETWRGSGARGQAYETSGYKLTFGGLSSY